MRNTMLLLSFILYIPLVSAQVSDGGLAFIKMDRGDELAVIPFITFDSNSHSWSIGRLWSIDNLRRLLDINGQTKNRLVKKAIFLAIKTCDTYHKDKSFSRP